MGMDGDAPAQQALGMARLEEACLGFDRAWPERSARRRLGAGQALVLLTAIAALGALFALWPMMAMPAFAAVGLVVFAAAGTLRLAAALFALAPSRAVAARWTAPLPVYTVLCPMRAEARVAANLIAALRRLDYPPHLLDVKLVLEADDVETVAAVAAAAPPAWELVRVPPAAPRTKPKALNYALQTARGAFVVVYDAEDRPAPSQLRAALDAFAARAELGCVQAPLAIDNVRSSWIARQFAAEYAALFLAILPLLARLGLPFPLGGTSNHFRREALDACGGWDPFNVTEDADIGLRLARDGWRLGVIEPPTWEEAPRRLRAWSRQRTRWIKGHLHTGLILLRRPGVALREVGFGGLGVALLMLIGGPASAIAHAPLTALAAIAALQEQTPAMFLGFAVFGYAANVAAAHAGARRLRAKGVAGASLAAPLYWMLIGWPALCAVVDFVRRPHFWAKTEHGDPDRQTPAAHDHPDHDHRARPHGRLLRLRLLAAVAARRPVAAAPRSMADDGGVRRVCSGDLCASPAAAPGRGRDPLRRAPAPVIVKAKEKAPDAAHRRTP